MKKKGLAFLLVLLSLILICTFSLSAAEPKTIQFWDALTREPHIIARDAMIKDFEKETGIRVEVTTMTGNIDTKIQAAAAARTLPDIIFMWNAPQIITYSQMGILAPVSDLIKGVGGTKYFINDRLITCLNYNKQYWGIPLVTYPGIMFYRKDVYDKKGIQAPRTWNEWYKAAVKTNEDTDGDGKIDRYGVVFGIGEGWPYGLLRSSNADYWWDAKGRDTVGKRTAETIDFFRKMFNDAGYPGSVTLTNEGQRMAFLSNAAASMVTSTSFLYPLLTDKPDWLKNGIVAAAPVPMNRLGDPKAGVDCPIHGLTVVDGPNKELAKKFLKFFMRKDNLIKYFSQNIPGQLPPYKVVVESKEFWNRFPIANPIIKAAIDTIQTTKWQEPITAWGGAVNMEYSGQLIMQHVAVDKWPTEKIVNGLHDAIKRAKAEFR